MRNLILIGLTCLFGLAACGPSGRDVALAKTARYQGDKLVLFGAVKSVTESKYKLVQSDETTLTVQTTGRWYTPEGLAATSGEQDINRLPDKSINIALLVKLLPDQTNWIVHVEPVMLRYNRGMPNPERVTEKDPSVPGWATGKVDQLAFDIHDALKQYEVKSGGPQMPPPATDNAAPEAPAPEAPAPEAPAPEDPAPDGAAPTP